MNAAILAQAKPILFNTEMVRAIPAGNKTQTRRVIKLRYDNTHIELKLNNEVWEMNSDWCRVIKPQYNVGDILYVRETHCPDWCDHFIYKANGGSAIAAGYSAEPKWTPSIHMPKSAARIFLRVTAVLAERLQDISESDAMCEGALKMIEIFDRKKCRTIFMEHCDGTYLNGFVSLWNSTIEKDKRDCYGWDANPWVWVYEFEKTTMPED